MIGGTNCITMARTSTIPSGTKALTSVIVAVTTARDSVSDNGEIMMMATKAGNGHEPGAGVLLHQQAAFSGRWCHMSVAPYSDQRRMEPWQLSLEGERQD